MLIVRVLRLPYLIAFFALGLVFIALDARRRKTIFVFPTPDTIDSIQYTDATGRCFAAHQTAKKCKQ